MIDDRYRISIVKKTKVAWFWALLLLALGQLPDEEKEIYEVVVRDATGGSEKRIPAKNQASARRLMARLEQEFGSTPETERAQWFASLG